MIPYVFMSEAVKRSADDLELQRLVREFERRRHRGDVITGGYDAISEQLEASRKLRHPKGLPFLRKPKFMYDRHMSQYGWKPGIVFAPAKGDAVDLMRKPQYRALMPEIAKRWSPEERQMFTDLVKAHEVDEVTATPGRAFLGYGHSGPEVILREHNRIAGLDPERFPRTIQAFKEMRGGYHPWWLALVKGWDAGEASLIRKVDPDFRYGEGPPLTDEEIATLSGKLEARALRHEHAARAGWAGAALGTAALIARKKMRGESVREALRRALEGPPLGLAKGGVVPAAGGALGAGGYHAYQEATA